MKEGRNNKHNTRLKITPLYIAAKQGKLEDVKQLLKQGADVNACDYFKNTPLHSAIFATRNTKLFDEKSQNNQFEIIKILIEHKANLNVENIMGITPVQAAFGKKVIEKLEQPKSPTKNYEDAQKTFIFSKMQDLKILKLLIDNGANADISSSEHPSARYFTKMLMQNERINNYPEARKLINDIWQSINKDDYNTEENKVPSQTDDYPIDNTYMETNEQEVSATGNVKVVFDEAAM